MVKIVSVFVILFLAVVTGYSVKEISDQREIATLVHPGIWLQGLSNLDNKAWDLRASALRADGKSENIVLIKIDDSSIAAYGRFPWSRKVWSELLNKLAEAKVKVVSFDVYFSESERPDIDRKLADSIRNIKNTGEVVFPYSVSAKPLLGPDSMFFDQLPAPLFSALLPGSVSESTRIVPAVVEKKVFPTEIFLNAAPQLGFVAALADIDGVFRLYPYVASIDGLLVPSLALSSVLSLKKNDISLEDSAGRLKMNFNGNSLFLNSNGESLLTWRYTENYFPVLSVKEIMERPAADLKILEGKLAFVGSTAYGAHDLRNTPLSPELPGIYFHMNAAEDLLQSTFVSSGLQVLTLNLKILIFITAIMLATVFVQPISAVLGIFFVTTGLLWGADRFIFLPAGQRLYLAILLLYLFFNFVFFIGFRFFISQNEKKKIKNSFSRYLSPGIIKDILENPAALKLGGEKKKITVFFSDIRGFTEISEQLTPEKLSEALNIYMTHMTDILFEHGGTLDKYIGDAIVAYWGAPVEMKNAAFAALKAAVQMTEKLSFVNGKLAEAGVPRFEHGIGLNTGSCIVGNMGSQQIFSYTAIGDGMNLGARVESLCKFYGAKILFTEHTLKELNQEEQNLLQFRTVDKIQVKGKKEHIRIFELLTVGHFMFSQHDLQKEYERAFDLYQNRGFSDALGFFESHVRKFPADLAAAHLKALCESYLKTPPPPDWDGVYRHLQK